MEELSLFSETKQIEDETLIIIGNGFDISHGIESRYSDFRKWLVSKNRRSIIDLMDIFFSNKRDFWCDIELAFGEYDEDGVLSYCRPDEEFDMDHSLSSAARIEDSPNDIFMPAVADFKNSFKEWVNSIDIKGVQRNKSLSTRCKYLSFNYTETLESIYGISSNNVAHIHGSRLLNDDYIIGHNNYRNPYDAWDDESLIFECQAKENIIRWMNEFVKKYRENITKHQDFFDQLVNVKHIISYGHSMNKIDWPYFEEIINKTGKDIQWKVSCFKETDVDNTTRFKSQYGLSNLAII